MKKSETPRNRIPWELAVGVAVLVTFVFKGVFTNSLVNWGENELGVGFLAFSIPFYHLVSLLLHGANCGLLFLVLCRIFQAPGDAKIRSTGLDLWLALATVWFGVHPLRVEAVAWSRSQRELWGVFTALVFTHLYLSVRPREARTRWDGLAVLLVLATLLSAGARHFCLQTENVRRSSGFYILAELIQKTLLPFRIFPSYPFAYLSGIAATMVAVACLSRKKLRAPSQIALVAGYAVTLLLAVQSVKMIPLWRDPESFWRYVTSLPDGKTAGAYLKLGSSMVDHGDITEAEEAFRKSVHEDPTLFDAHNKLGLCLLTRGERNQAKEEFEKAISLSPNFAGAMSNRAQALSQMGQLTEALSQVEKAVALTPEDPIVRENQARILEMLQRNAEAAEPWRIVVRAHPSDGAARNHLGGALFQMGKIREAAEQYREATVISPTNAYYRFNLAMMLLKLGDRAAAKQQLQLALQFDNAFGAAREELAKLN